MKKRRTFTVGAAVVAVFALLPGPPRKFSGRVESAEPDTTMLARFDISTKPTVLMVPVTVGRDPFQFGLATADFSVFSRAFAKSLPRLEAGLDRPDDEFLGTAYRAAPQISVGNLRLQFPYPWVQCANPGTIFGAQFIGSDGVIGLDILAEQIVEINFDEGTIRFLSSVPKNPGDRFEITSLRKRPRACAVTIKARCCDEPVEDFYVELENPDAISIRAPVYRQLFEKRQIRNLRTESAIGAGRPVLVGSASSFELGRFQTKNVRVAVSGDNVIGLEYLSRYLVTFDFPQGVMYLRPGKQFERADKYDMSGLYAKVRKKALRICHLLRARKSGRRSGPSGG